MDVWVDSLQPLIKILNKLLILIETELLLCRLIIINSLWLLKESQQYFLRLDSFDNQCITLTHNGWEGYMPHHPFVGQDMGFQALAHGMQ
jgi:hypothetical protein